MTLCSYEKSINTFQKKSKCKVKLLTPPSVYMCDTQIEISLLRSRYSITATLVPGMSLKMHLASWQHGGGSWADQSSLYLIRWSTAQPAGLHRKRMHQLHSSQLPRLFSCYWRGAAWGVEEAGGGGQQPPGSRETVWSPFISSSPAHKRHLYGFFQTPQGQVPWQDEIIRRGFIE